MYETQLPSVPPCPSRRYSFPRHAAPSLQVAPRAHAHVDKTDTGDNIRKLNGSTDSSGRTSSILDRNYFTCGDASIGTEMDHLAKKPCSVRICSTASLRVQNHMLDLAHSTTLIFFASTVMGDALRRLLSLNDTYTNEASMQTLRAFVHLEAMSGHVTGPTARALHQRNSFHLLESFVECHHGNV